MSYFKEYLENVNTGKMFKIIKQDLPKNSSIFRKMENYIRFPNSEEAQSRLYGLYSTLVFNYSFENDFKTVEEMKNILMKILIPETKDVELEYEHDGDYEAWEQINVKFPKQLEEELNERNKRKSYK